MESCEEVFRADADEVGADVGDEVTRLILFRQGTRVGRSASEWKSESPDVAAYP